MFRQRIVSLRHCAGFVAPKFVQERSSTEPLQVLPVLLQGLLSSPPGAFRVETGSQPDRPARLQAVEQL